MKNYFDHLWAVVGQIPPGSDERQGISLCIVDQLWRIGIKSSPLGRYAAKNCNELGAPVRSLRLSGKD